MRKLFLLASAIALISQPALAQLQSQVVAGSDNGATRRILKTDNTGRLEVVGAAAGGVVYGPDAENAPPSQDPLLASCIYRAAPPTVTDGDIVILQCDANGKLNVNAAISGSVSATVTQATASNLNAQVVGAVAANAANTGNPVKIGCNYNSSLPTYDNGDIGDVQCTSSGELITRTFLTASTGTPLTIGASGADNSSNTRNAYYSYGYISGYDGSTWDRLVTIDGASTSVGVLGVAQVPTNSANAAVTPQATTAVASNLVLCSAACNFYGAALTTGAVGGYLMVFNATSAPADGAVTPTICRAIGANSSVEVDYSTSPRRMSTGATAVFSTTGCYTKTASATAAIEGASEQ